MTPDVALNKKESIERCIRQIHIYYAIPSDEPFESDFLKQDAIAANLQRAAEQTIDLAKHAIRKGKLGLPKDSRDSFDTLATAKVISADLAKNERDGEVLQRARSRLSRTRLEHPEGCHRASSG